MNEEKQCKHRIDQVVEGSIAYKLGIRKGYQLVRVNEFLMEDVFDYLYHIQEQKVSLELQNLKGEFERYEIFKEADEDLGIQFASGLMDDYKRCHNQCIFCFIDQMPPGMRETLYFKDDDSRLSFLQGNYVTLTNMAQKDIDRIVKYRLSPINISFQTMNPELRCKMMNNRFAGESLAVVDRFYEESIAMNGQIVLCKGVNDGKELAYSLEQLYRYVPVLESLSVVPVGLSKFRDGLYSLEPFHKEDAKEVLTLIHQWQEKAMKEHGVHFVHASDEWYILAGTELPPEDNYDGYLQLENGVGMLRLLMDEFKRALCKALHHYYGNFLRKLFFRVKKRTISLATGKLAYPFINKMAAVTMRHFPQLEIMVYPIRNDFFGEGITVSGLLTGQDIIAQLQGVPLGECLYLPQNVLRSGENVFLDDVTLEQVEKALQVRVDIVKSSGQDLLNVLLGTESV